MNRMRWQSIHQGELAMLLKKAKLDDSRAVGVSTVYQFTVDGQDVVAVSLPDGQAVLVELNTLPNTQRRHIDTAS